MIESELDRVYTQLCKTMTDLGEARSPLFLARSALREITESSDLSTAQRLIDEAREGLNSPEAETAASSAGQ